jgi:HK97 family phage major capsid protein
MGMIAMSNRDAAYSALGADAIARMQRHGSEVEIEARTNKRLASELHEVRADLKSRAGASGEYEQRVTPSGAAGFGGELIPPVWLVDQTAKFLRPGRVFADRVTKMPLMPGTNSINWPKLTLGTLTGPQSGQNAPVSSQDFTTTSVNAPVLTYAGQADVSLQMIEQSPLGGGVDGLLSDDLGRDLDQRLDIAIISGSGVNGQHLGLLNVPQATSPSVSQMSSVACTSTTFFDGITTAGTQYRAIINAVNQIETLTFSTFRPTAIWCHPRRSNSWAITATDSNKRPLFVAPSYQAFSNLGINEASPVPEGLAGELYGLGVYKDANMNTTNLAAATTGGTQDPIIVLNESVPILFEGAVRYRALPEVLSGTLAVRFQKYQYSAWMPTRFPQAIAVITGAGVVGPTF